MPSCADSSRFRRRSALPAALLVACALSLAVAAVTAAPPRVASPHGALDLECGLCHGAEGWRPARISPRFAHGRGGFPLAGAHATAACLDCHGSLEFRAADTRCATCHEDVHRGELGADCARCHTARSFLDRGGMRRAHALTRFPLTGSHVALDCEACHAPAAQGQLRFVGARAECAACHLEAWRAARAPDHAASGFSTDCVTCHSTLDWRGAGFDHARTRFPLTGAHRAIACADCHGGGVYRGLAADCASCHRADYDRTTAPPHAATGFPTTCASCHGTATWDGARFDHDSANFPIYSGKHAGRWQACADCHTTSADYRQFTCFTCHPHSDRAKTDGNHQGRSGYSYDSRACYTCHPRGNT